MVGGMSLVRRALLRRVDHVWDMGWFNLIGMALVGFFLYFASMMLSDGIDNLRAEKWGVDGALTVNLCDKSEWGKGPPWRCYGTFVSSDGTLRISGVEYEFRFEADMTETPGAFYARVAGPGSSSAWPPGDEWQASLIVGSFGLFVAGMFFVWWVSPDDVATPKSPHLVAGRRGRTRKVRRLAHARRRRRRRRRR